MIVIAIFVAALLVRPLLLWLAADAVDSTVDRITLDKMGKPAEQQSFGNRYDAPHTGRHYYNEP